MHQKKPMILNQYNYCASNPLRYIDPMGYDLEDNYKIDIDGKDNPVKVTVTENTVEINVYVQYTGNTDMKFTDGTLYKDLTTEGIKLWADTYDDVFGENVTVNVNVHEGRQNSWWNILWGADKQKYLKIELNDKLGTPNTENQPSWDLGKTSKINMFKGKNNEYTQDEFKWVVTHEVGHLFGLGDAYEDDKEGRPDAKDIVGENDVMRYPYNGINIHKTDIEMLILAFSTGECQYYSDYGKYKKSECID